MTNTPEPSDYEIFLQEIQKELLAGMLKEDNQLQILRSTESVKEDYYPIIDWYYPVDYMEELLTPDVDDTEEETEIIVDTKKQYDTDKPNLEPLTVKDCLVEMTKWDKIIK